MLYLPFVVVVGNRKTDQCFLLCVSNLPNNVAKVRIAQIPKTCHVIYDGESVWHQDVQITA